MLNGGMTPWDYFTQGTAIAQRNQGLQNQQQAMQARMEQMRMEQRFREMQQERANQMMPLQMGLKQAQTAKLDPNSPDNIMLRNLHQAMTYRANSQSGKALAQTAQLNNGTGVVSPNSPQGIDNRAQLLQYTNALSEHKLQSGMLNKNVAALQKQLSDSGASALMDAPNIWPVDSNGKAVDENDPAAVAIGYGVDAQGGLSKKVSPLGTVGGTMGAYRQLKGAQQRLQGLTPPTWKGSANSIGGQAQAAIDKINSSGLPDAEKAARIAQIHARLSGAVAPPASQAPPAGEEGDAGSVGDEGEPGEDDTQDTEDDDQEGQ